MLGFISELLSNAVQSFDKSLEGTPPHQIVLGAAALYFIYNQYHNPSISRAYRSRYSETLKQRGLDLVYGIGMRIPLFNSYVTSLKDKELNKNLESTRIKITTERSKMNLSKTMPITPRTCESILTEFDIRLEECAFNFGAISKGDRERESYVERGEAKDSGTLYAAHPPELTHLLNEVYKKTALTNPMHERWPRINAMQAEVMSWCLDLFHGSDEGYGLITHGGTTSIIEAMAAYVSKARSDGIAYPEIVVPETAHAAFKKAAELTGATLIIVPVEAKTGAVKAATMRGFISSNTAVIVGSAPSFMNGINDPIGELGQMAQKMKVPFHVDACLGGFLTAFLDTSDAPMDFRVPGVTSISADTHKYGLCPKGTSVCLFSKDSPVLPVYAALNWSGGLYATPGILDGSTSGARVAEIYTVLSYYGKERFSYIAAQILQRRKSIQELLEAAYAANEISREEVSIYGNPQWSVLGFRSLSLNPHLIADELDQRGWKLNLLQNPAGFHFCLTSVHTLVEGFAQQFIADLKQAVQAVKYYPTDKKPSGNVKVYGVVGTLPTAIQQEVCIGYQRERLKIRPSEGGIFATPCLLNTTQETSLTQRVVTLRK